VARVDAYVIKPRHAIGVGEGAGGHYLVLHRRDVKVMGHRLGFGEGFPDGVTEGLRRIPEEILHDELTDLREFIRTGEPGDGGRIYGRGVQVHPDKKRYH
jgi:hypothetical protein